MIKGKERKGIGVICIYNIEMEVSIIKGIEVIIYYNN
jgi:hypothetical protein